MHAAQACNGLGLLHVIELIASLCNMLLLVASQNVRVMPFPRLANNPYKGCLLQARFSTIDAPQAAVVPTGSERTSSSGSISALSVPRSKITPEISLCPLPGTERTAADPQRP